MASALEGSGTCKPKASNFSTDGYMYLVDNHRDLFQLPSAIIFNHFLYVMGSNLSQTFPPKPLFSVEQIPDLTGQVIIVTGGNAGLGKETCKALLNKNAKVYLAARSKSRADDAIEWLKSEANGKAPVFLELDLGNLASVRKAAEDAPNACTHSKEQELHVLFNNAADDLNSGVMAPPVEQRTSDGYDLQFGTNVLGHYFFTVLLLPTLIHTAKNSPFAMINTSSASVYLAPKSGIVWETLGTGVSSITACKKLGTHTLYAQSKLLAKRYAHQGVISSSLNPASYGALTQLWSGTMSEGKDHNGKFPIPWARVGDAGANSHDEELAEKLWDWLEEQVKEWWECVQLILVLRSGALAVVRPREVYSIVRCQIGLGDPAHISIVGRSRDHVTFRCVCAPMLRMHPTRSSRVLATICTGWGVWGTWTRASTCGRNERVGRPNAQCGCGQATTNNQRSRGRALGRRILRARLGSWVSVGSDPQPPLKVSGLSFSRIPGSRAPVDFTEKP
ncbi:short chain dehydrogenase domain-containing protein [Rhizoctonia solani AG-1 IA]|uniref:Short chain dehydrogenase domain-containing protein n=1 Tax=Thanatephorus cucumeris (strain AG1-IA) TaxID=983506 RepID=L8WUZ2_THACA|nr:short chain dehydrogenase domain-containing protein [Rhizoctonia solani AG-1 IA]